jgi:hypothetical protein
MSGGFFNLATVLTGRRLLLVTSGTRLALRGVAFAIIALWMIAGPVYTQIFDGSDDVFRPWVMYSGVGLGLMDITFYEQKSGGIVKQIDLRSTFGYSTVHPRLMSKNAVDSLGEDICSLLGKGADVRLVARSATDAGWHTWSDGRRNICAP